MKNNLFITFEGTDGSGKSSQIDLLYDYLNKKGLDILFTREPGGTAIGEKIRELILDVNNSEMSHMTEAMLYAASRAQHVDQVIKPALDSGKTVICDRFVDSSIVYQGYGRGLGNAVDAINEFAVRGCVPDLTFLLKLEPQKSIARLTGREDDRIESEELSYHEDVYAGYLQLEKKYNNRIIGIDADNTIENIQEIIRKHVEEYLE